MARWWVDISLFVFATALTIVLAVSPYARLVETPASEDWYVPVAPFVVGSVVVIGGTRAWPPTRRFALAAVSCLAVAFAAQIAVERYKGPELWIAETVGCFALLAAGAVLGSLAIASRLSPRRTALA